MTINLTETVMIAAAGLVVTLLVICQRGQTFLSECIPDTKARARFTAFLVILIGVVVQIILDGLCAPSAYGNALLALNSAIAGVFAGTGWANWGHVFPSPVKTCDVSAKTKTMFFVHETSEPVNRTAGNASVETIAP